MDRKAQATLEFTLVFILVAFLIVGLLVLWAWSKDNIGARMSWFEGSRISAGTKSNAGNPEVPPLVNPPPEPQMLNR